METDILITGTGPTARLAAHVLSRDGQNCLMVGPPDPRAADPRTTALMPQAVEDLRQAGIEIGDLATPLRTLTIQATGPFGVAEHIFTAQEVGVDHLALNVPVPKLIARIGDHATERDTVRAVRQDAGRAVAELGSGRTITARLVVAADGQASPSRVSAGIGWRRLRLGRTALAALVAHDPNPDLRCIERYHGWGSLTLIPVAPELSSVILIGPPSRIKPLADLDDPALGAALTALQPVFGDLRPTGPKAAFPLQLAESPDLVRGRGVAGGEAAHAMPPIAAQGWNLSVRDVLCLSRVLAEGRDRGLDLGDPKSLRRYPGLRRGDQRSRLLAVGALATVGTSGLAPVHILRQAGLRALTALPPVKRALMREGLNPARAW